LQALPFTVPHDAREPLQLRCSDGNRHLGIVTDLGHPSSHVVASLQGCHALLVEANHDPDLLQASSYPNFLKQRVAGPWGHLANHAAADLLKRVLHGQLSHVLAAHLSERTNTPELARASLSEALNCAPSEVNVADPTTGSEWVTV
jgi:phosphoribosyl 1,2-cyclic phosphodiesterase